MERQESEGGCLSLLLLIFGVALLFLAVVWFVSLVGHALGLTPSYPEIDRHDGAWIHAHYDLIGLGYVLTLLALLVGVPASAALTAELWSGRVRTKFAAGLAALLGALVFAIAVAPAGPSH